jgi:hypothetical protein
VFKGNFHKRTCVRYGSEFPSTKASVPCGERIDVTARIAAGDKQFAVTRSTPLFRFHDEAFLKQFVPDYQAVKEEPNNLFVDLAEESPRHRAATERRADPDGGKMRRT